MTGATLAADATTIAGKAITNSSRSNYALAYEVLPGNHSKNKVNVVLADGRVSRWIRTRGWRTWKRRCAPVVGGSLGTGGTAAACTISTEPRAARSCGAFESADGVNAMRVLVAEDHASLARSVANGLREEGYAVDLTFDGDEALRYASDNPYDCIVLDVMMPGKTGFQVVETLRRNGSKTPVFF